MLKLGLLANRSLEKLNLCQVKMTDEGQCGTYILFYVYTSFVCVLVVAMCLYFCGKPLHLGKRSRCLCSKHAC